MTPVVRFYASLQDAEGAVRKLADYGFREDGVMVMSPRPEGNDSEVNAAAGAGVIRGHVAACRAALQRGRHVVAVSAPFGRALSAAEILSEYNPVEIGMVPEYRSDDPAPFSDLLGIPALSSVRSTTQLSKSAAPLSGMFGLPTLTKRRSKNTSFMFPTLTKSRSKNTSFMFPTLTKSRSKNSSFFLPLLSRSQSGWTTSFGFPLLSRNAAPLSSMFGMATLKRNRRSDER